MRFDVITLFPEMFPAVLAASVLGRAIARGVASVHVHQLREWAPDRRGTVDDAPFGGGAGMVMTPGPLVAAIRAVADLDPSPPLRILLSPSGRRLDHALAQELSQLPRLLLVCGRYEGIDQRVRELAIDAEVSLGDFVLSGGEIAAMAIIDAVVRLQPDAISGESLDEESHSSGLLEYPHYTRPAVFEGLPVPNELLSGNHAAIAAWRRKQALLRTARTRPDLLESADLSTVERRWIEDGAR